MPKGENIICISSIDWDFIWQGHQEIMSALAKDGNRVFFIENTGVRMPGIKDFPRITRRIKNWFTGIRGIREEENGLYVFSPMVLPFPYSRIALWINRHFVLSILEKWIKIMHFTNPIIWVFLPTPLSLSIIDGLNSKIVVYYCIDNFRVSSVSAKKIKQSEVKLLKKADLVFVTSRELFNYCSQYNQKVSYFPFAVNFKDFEKARLEECHPLQEFKDIKKPIIGYIGGVHKWIDFALVKIVAQKLPQYSFVFIGPIQADISQLEGVKNIYFLGKKEHEELPFCIKNFDVCIVPYAITDYTKNVYPTKLNEYLAMGKPVVSTELPEVVNFNEENDNLVFIAKSEEEFVRGILQAAVDNNESLIKKRIAAAEKNSWDRRIAQMGHLIDEQIKVKAEMPPDWKTGILKIYRSSRKKLLKASFILLGIYFILFYTPLLWFIAAPLKITQAPKNADCIVVFAGGVGESGKAGQGYEERVEYAVELYRKGYAKHIIFSSGYMYALKEPLIMKAVATSLGVPQDAIILEDKASGTFQNVKFTNDILLKNNWNNILFVSSPYHMRRVSLVFRKNAQGIKVTYIPIQNSLFYSHPDKDELGRKVWKKANIQQIKGILHEYLGILYYWWRGWI